MGVPQYTTPTFFLTFSEPDLDLTQANNVYVTFRSGQEEITKSTPNISVSEKSISVFLSQEETKRFRIGEVEIQANWTTPNGGRFASKKCRYPISDQLLRRVIE